MPVRSDTAARTPGTIPTTMSFFDSAIFDSSKFSGYGLRPVSRTVFTAGTFDSSTFDYSQFGPAFTPPTTPRTDP